MTSNQINYWTLKENIRANQEREFENRRSNLAKERETERANRNKESETRRSNMANEAINRAGIIVKAADVGVDAITSLF